MVTLQESRNKTTENLPPVNDIDTAESKDKDQIIILAKNKAEQQRVESIIDQASSKIRSLVTVVLYETTDSFCQKITADTFRNALLVCPYVKSSNIDDIFDAWTGTIPSEISIYRGNHDVWSKMIPIFEDFTQKLTLSPTEGKDHFLENFPHDNTRVGFAELLQGRGTFRSTEGKDHFLENFPHDNTRVGFAELLQGRGTFRSTEESVIIYIKWLLSLKGYETTSYKD